MAEPDEEHLFASGSDEEEPPSSTDSPQLLPSSPAADEGQPADAGTRPGQDQEQQEQQEEQDGGIDATMHDLFSEDEEDEEPPDDSDAQRRQQQGAASTSKPEEGTMALEAPLQNLPPGRQLHLLKLTNIVGIEPQPFNPLTFDDKQEEEETYIDGGTGRVRLRMRSQNVMRWRHRPGPDGKTLRESNARFVRWSDGSLQLLLGDDVLDVATQDISGDHTYLCTVHGLIQGQAQLASRMALRPASLKSKLHSRLKEKVQASHSKQLRVGVHNSLLDPEAQKAKKEKLEAERIQNLESLKRKQDAVTRKYAGGAPGGGGGLRRSGGYTKARLTADYLEGALDEDAEYDEDGFEDDDGLTVSERARSHLSRPRHISEAQEAEAARRLEAAKRAPPPPVRSSKRARFADSDGEEGGGDDGSDRDEPPAKAAAPPKAKARRGVVMSDDESE